MPDREKVIKGLECMKSIKRPTEEDCASCGYKESFDCGRDVGNDALALIKKQEWIPVSDRLPKSIANKVIVYLQHEDLVSQIGYGHYEKFQGEEMWYDLEHNEQFSKRGYTVTHWMPLPESPKGERLTLS